MPQANATGATGSQDVETQTTEIEEIDTETQTGETEGDEPDAKLPKNQDELNKLISDRLKRQEKTFDKKLKAELKKVTDLKDKSELEVERQKASGLVGKIAEKNFLMAAKDAGADQALAEKLYKLNKLDFELDEDGEILNLDELMDAAKKEFEDLFKKKKKGSGDGGSGGDKISDPVKEFNDSIKAGLGY